MLTQPVGKVIIWPSSTQILTVSDIKDDVTGNFWNGGASISGTLVDDQGNPVPGFTLVPLLYVPGTNGTFQGSFGGVNFQPLVGTGYTILLDGVNGNTVLHEEILAEVRVKQD